jgi:diadenosine tetraphosphate (Ap4A) HIT family hydrolase
MESNDNFAWKLDAQIERDSAPVGDLTLSSVRTMNDATYPWLVLVPRRAGVTEIIDLAETDRAQLMTEISAAATALKDITRCDKLNIGAIGNLVPQLHIHIVARRRGDPAWPKPVWGMAPPIAYAPQTLDAFVEAVREVLGLALSSS